MFKTTALMAFMFCAASHASSLSLIVSDDAKVNGAKAVYLNQYVLFFGEQLSVYDTTSNRFEVIEIDSDFVDGGSGDVPTPPDVSFYNIEQLNGYVYFTVNIEQTYADHTYTALWRSNGTAAGTEVYRSEPLFNAEAEGSLSQINGFLVGYGFDEKVLISNGNSTYQHDIGVDLARFTCVFAVDHIVFTQQFEPLTRSQQGTITEFDIPLAWSINPFYPVFTSAQDDCLVEASVFGETPGRKLFHIPRTGSETLLTDSPGLENVVQVFSHNDRIIAYTGDQLLRLTPDLKAFDASVPVTDDTPTPRYFVQQQTSRSLFHFKASRFNGNTTESVDTLHHFTRSQSTEFLSNANQPSAVYSTSNTEHFFHYKAPTDSLNKTGRLWLDVTKNNQSFIDFPANQTVDIINNTDQTKLYALVTDDESQTSEFFQVVDDIEISALINGGWFDTSIQNQGLNIRKGLREGGSDYVTVTGYTFRNGQPLWFAGDTNLDLPQQTVTVELREFSGIGLFEPGARPDNTVFGELEFRLTSCHTMSATITTEDETFELNLSRLDDVTYTQNCVD